jgi:hypothetical protein
MYTFVASVLKRSFFFRLIVEFILGLAVAISGVWGDT